MLNSLNILLKLKNFVLQAKTIQDVWFNTIIHYIFLSPKTSGQNIIDLFWLQMSSWQNLYFAFQPVQYLRYSP